MKNHKRQNSLPFIGLIFILLSLLLTASTQTLAYGAGDVIAAVNSLRAEYGFKAYDASQALNDICQEQAEYMASIDTLTHDRADGSSIPTTSENIAYGPIDRAMASWVDDQLHFDTLIAWSSGQVGAGVAESGGIAYICLNVTRYDDTEFNQIPFTQGPGEEIVATPVIVPTAEDSTPLEEVQPGEEENPAQEPVVDEATAETPLAMVYEEETGADAEASATDEVVPLSEPEPQNGSLAIESSTGKMIAYVLMGIGVVGLGGSLYGMLYALRLMGKKKPPKKQKPPKKERGKSKKKKSETGESIRPNEAQEE